MKAGLHLLRLCLLAVLALAAAEASAGSYTANASQDAYISEGSPTTNTNTATLRATATATNTSRTRSAILFTLPTIPSNETITSVSLRLVVTTSTTRVVTVNRLNSSWSETAITWNNFNSAFNSTAEATFTPSATGVVTVDVTSLVKSWYDGSVANNGLGLTGAASSGAIFASSEATTIANRPQLLITTATISPSITVAKSSSLVSDPVNGTVNPKAIPGAIYRFTISASNSTAGTADANSTVFTDPVPAGMKLRVSDIGAPGSGPVAFANAATSSGLNYTFTSLASTTDSLSFSNNGGSTYTYTPVPDASGYDSSVTHVRVTLTGTFAGKTGSSDPGLTMQMMLQVK